MNTEARQSRQSHFRIMPIDKFVSFSKRDLVDKLEIGELAKSVFTDSTVRIGKGAINHGPMIA